METVRPNKTQKQSPVLRLLLGNEAIARGALEAGVRFAAGYPGTPSSEIIDSLALFDKNESVHVEWSINEKVATEVSAAASFSGLRALAAMKTAGLPVATDFLLHLSLSGLAEKGGGFLVVVCDDPEGHSSGDEADSRWLARYFYAPLLEPCTISEAKDMTKWAFDLSEEFKRLVLLRSYTRLSHASGGVELGPINRLPITPHFDTSLTYSPYLAKTKHAESIRILTQIQHRFNKSLFNSYQGPPDAELVVVCSGSGYLCSLEALEELGIEDNVGVLKIGTVWPFPYDLVKKTLSKAKRVLVIEETDPFLESNIQGVLTDQNGQHSNKLYGKMSGHVPHYGEITPEIVISALCEVQNLTWQSRPKNYKRDIKDLGESVLIDRGMTWCPGCPHRASFWLIDRAMKATKREAILTGDIGCYTLDVFPEGAHMIKLLHGMGSGAGLATGLGQLGDFGFNQPVVSVVGDSTFFHAVIPALVNAVHHKSNFLLVVLDNSTTAMTGFQPHPGTNYDVKGGPAIPIKIEDMASTLACNVEIADPFDVKGSRKKLKSLLERENGVRVLIFRRTCELLRKKREKTSPYRVRVLMEKCKGRKCGICVSEFRCPALTHSMETDKVTIHESLCSGCGACSEVCPFKAIEKTEAR